MFDRCSCLLCRKKFPVKGFHTHYARIHLNDKRYYSGNNGKYDVMSKRVLDRYNRNPKKCFHCDEILSFENKNNKFCNSSCSATYNNIHRANNGWTPSVEHRKKVSEKLSGRQYVIPYEKIKICLNCDSQFKILVIGNKREKRFCCKPCATRYSSKIKYEKLRLTKTEQENYRRDCKFRFNIKYYLAEFDFALLKQHGFYKAKNRGNNLTGVSRDHMVSLTWGWLNKIPPEHIAHPANCRLMIHSENVSKGTKNHITYEELLARIAQWDERYNLSCLNLKFSVC